MKEKLTQNSIQNSTQLEAFGKNKFTVIYGRKQANIPNTIRNQNYGVIDSLARNGVICSPETRNKLSIEILIEKLSKLNAFHIVIIHPSYLLKYNSSTYPCENIEPSYKLNEGEILAVFYRYICITVYRTLGANCITSNCTTGKCNLTIVTIDCCTTCSIIVFCQCYLWI